MSGAGILYLETGTSEGGSFESLYQTLKVLDRQRFDPTVVFLNPNRFTAKLDALGVRYFVFSDPVYSRSWGWLLPRVFGKLSQIVGTYGRGLSILYEFMVHLPSILRLCALVKKHSIRILHANDQINRDFFALFICTFLRIRMVSHLRAPERGGFNRCKAQYANARVAAYISYSAERTKGWIAAGLQESRCKLIPNGIDPAEVIVPTDIRGMYGLPKDAPVIGSVGTVIPERGYEFLIESFSLLAKERPDCRLLIVGGGEKKLRSGLNALIRSLGLEDKVFLPGFSHNGKGVLAALDVLVLPYKNEPLGRTLLEAWLCHTPVIATDFGGIREVIESGRNGLLVDYGDTGGLKSAMLSLIDNGDLRQQVAMEGRKTVEEKYDIRACVRQIEEVYDQLL